MQFFDIACRFIMGSGVLGRVVRSLEHWHLEH